MTVGAGRPWGDMVPAPEHVVRLSGDAAIAQWVSAQGPTRPVGGPVVVPRSGDLFRAVGGSLGVDRVADGGEVARLPCDLLRVSLDGRSTVAVAHVVVRTASPLGWWRGRVVAFMNVQYLGEWDVAPRAHPNDGRVDLVQVAAAMSVRDRWAARRRLPLGSHLPHPAITTRQVRSQTIELGRGEHVIVDGVDLGGGTRLDVTVEPDAFTVCV